MQNKEMLPKKLLPIYRTVRCHIPSDRRKGKNAKFCLCTLWRHSRVWRYNSNDFYLGTWCRWVVSLTPRPL